MLVSNAVNESLLCKEGGLFLELLRQSLQNVCDSDCK